MQKEIKRKCQGCRIVKDRSEMIKITKLQEGCLKINPTSKESGRSVYVCRNADCIKELIKKKRIKTALKYSNIAEIERIEKELSEFV